MVIDFLENLGLSGVQLFLVTLCISGLLLVISYIIATYPSNKRRLTHPE